MKNIMKQFNWLSEWVMNLFILQFLWLGGTLIGGVILGLAPATTALFAYLRKLKRQETKFSLFQYYVQSYKENLKNSLVIGFGFLLAGVIGLIYSQFLSQTTDSWVAYTHIFIYLILFLMGLLLLYIFPVYVHFDLRLRSLLKTTFFIMMTSMKWNLPLILTLIATGLIFIRFAVVFLFFGASVPAFIILAYCMRAFEDFDLKKQRLTH